MFRPLVLYIGLRYTRAKRRNHFVSFISLASMIGIALGVTVLITVLSVMNGFDHEIHNRVFSLTRQITIRAPSNNQNDWQNVKEIVGQDTNVIASAPFVFGQGMLANNGEVRGVVINGILPSQEEKVSKMQDTVVQGSMDALESGKFGIVVGRSIALHLDLDVGDKVVLITPNATMTPIGVTPRYKRFTVVGVFSAGEGFSFDSTMAYINLHDAQKLFSLGKNVTGLNLKINDLYKAPMISDELANRLDSNYIVSDWTSEYGSFFKAIKMEKTMMFIVLLFIIAVAVFNLISSLVMTVNDKQSDIAILRTLGASPKMIMSIFIVQGGIIGLIGTLLGVIGGVLLALNAPELVRLLEQILHTQFISAGIYFVDYLPSRLIWADVWHVGLITLLMSLVATVYPAWRAAKTQPAEALRYE